MTRRFPSSRQRFEQYKQDVRQRQRSGEFLPAASPHGLQRRSRHRLRSSRELVVAFFDLLRGQYSAVAFGLAMLTIATILALAPPAATKLIVDYVLIQAPLPDYLARYGLPADRWELLCWIVAVVVTISLLKIAVQIMGRWSATRATKRMQMRVRKRVFEHAVRLPLSRVHELKSGGVASVLREDAGSVAELIFGMLYNPWRAVVQLSGSLCILAWVDWRLLMGALAILPIVFYTHRTWINRIRPRYRDVRARREEVDGQATETFAGMRIVRAFSRQRTETDRYMRNNHLMGRQELSVWWWARTVEMVWEALIPLGSAAMLLYGGWQVLQGNLSVGDLMMFLAYLALLLGPLAILAQSATAFQNSLSGLDRILDLLDEPREMPIVPDALRVCRSSVRGTISIGNVSFQYPDTPEPALVDIDLEVEAGQTIALVGPSGAGKTTLCNLIARFYDPNAGRIALDGIDLRQLDVENYRSLLGVVEQDVFLFDGTVIENIGYANRQATLTQIQDAARIANADEFIVDLQDGYETVIGERGVKLSGGQRQRIAIARAVLADPQILVLDEATSNLDTESERLIQQSLAALMHGRTCFVIAHRLSTIAHADLIVVLEQGRIRETGTHADLMDDDTRYREMVQVQTQPPPPREPDHSVFLDPL